ALFEFASRELTIPHRDFVKFPMLIKAAAPTRHTNVISSAYSTMSWPCSHFQNLTIARNSLVPNSPSYWRSPTSCSPCPRSPSGSLPLRQTKPPKPDTQRQAATCIPRGPGLLHRG